MLAETAELTWTVSDAVIWLYCSYEHQVHELCHNGTLLSAAVHVIV